MKSPFKFLDSYKREDHAQFFGREDETAKLYELVNQNRIVLIYGPIGTGKTSLVRCGLWNEFEDEDWLPVYIRRRTNFPDSIRERLKNLWDEKIASSNGNIEDNTYATIVEKLFAHHLRPLYLIFDQLEEIFILGEEDEREKFTEIITEIYDAEAPCKIIFIIREEYLAHLHDLEPYIPTLFKRRLRVEAMRKNQAKEVIRKSCEKFNITLEDPSKNLGQIVDEVSTSQGVVLSYLQVYLDRLYREDLEREIEIHGAEFAKQDYPLLLFTTEEIEKLGKIENILKAFLKEQIEIIEEDILEKEDIKNFSPGIINKILNTFVSIDGTKIPRTRENLEVPSPLDKGDVLHLLVRLQNARILRQKEGTFELAHDTLAEEIASQRTVEEQAKLEALATIQERYRTFNRQINRETTANKKLTFLNDEELQIVNNHQEALKKEDKISQKEWEFIEKSQHEANIRRKKRNYFYMILSGVLLVLLTITGVMAWEAGKARDKAEQNLNNFIQARIKVRNAEENADRRKVNDLNLRSLKLTQELNSLQKRIESGKKIYGKEGVADLVEDKKEVENQVDSLNVLLEMMVISIENRKLTYLEEDLWLKKQEKEKDTILLVRERDSIKERIDFKRDSLNNLKREARNETK